MPIHAAAVCDESSVDVISDLSTYMTLPMQIVTTVSAGAGAHVDCLDHDRGNAMGNELSIIAIRVGG